ncbi:hypothetical protein [Streptomyces sp. SAS_281]
MGIEMSVGVPHAVVLFAGLSVLEAAGLRRGTPGVGAARGR